MIGWDWFGIPTGASGISQQERVGFKKNTVQSIHLVEDDEYTVYRNNKVVVFSNTASKNTQCFKT